MEKLNIFNKSRSMLKKIYLVTKQEKVYRDFALIEQIRRAAISVTLNIAEGYGRGVKHFKSYLKISFGSVNEVIAALLIIQDIYQIDTSDLRKEYDILARQISAFSNSLPSS